jgi:hypothetical protein
MSVGKFPEQSQQILSNLCGNVRQRTEIVRRMLTKCFVFPVSEEVYHLGTEFCS